MTKDKKRILAYSKEEIKGELNFNLNYRLTENSLIEFYPVYFKDKIYKINVSLSG